MDFPQVWREFDDFYVLYTAAALKMAKGKDLEILVVVWVVVALSATGA
jgi:hypothetical protein